MQKGTFLVGVHGGEEEEDVYLCLPLQLLHQGEDLRVGFLLPEVHQHQLAEVSLRHRLKALRMVRVLLYEEGALLCQLLCEGIGASIGHCYQGLFQLLPL